MALLALSAAGASSGFIAGSRAGFVGELYDPIPVRYPGRRLECRR
jgi:hypothetical protein